MRIGIRQQATGESKNGRVFYFALCAILFVFCAAAGAQQPKKIPRIGYLAGFGNARDLAHQLEHFAKALRNAAIPKA